MSKVTDKIIYKLFEEKMLKRYLYVLVAIFISAINYNLFIYPSKIVAGGGNGLSILVQSLFNIKPSIFILIFSTVILIIAVCTIGLQKSSGALLSTFIYPLFVDMTSGITSIINPNNDDMTLICLFAGIISGFASGLIYKMGFSGGGVSLISKILYEKLRVSVSKVSFCMNLFIVLAGGIVFGFENIMYAVIFLYVDKIVIDRVLLGISNNKVFYIITNKDKEVEDFLTKKLGYNITEFEAIGGYNSQEDQVIMTVVSTRDYFKITEEIKKIDKNVFFIVTDSYQMKKSS